MIVQGRYPSVSYPARSSPDSLIGARFNCSSCALILFGKELVLPQVSLGNTLAKTADNLEM